LRSIRAFADLVLTSFLRPILFGGAHRDSLKPSLAAAWLFFGYPRSLSQNTFRKSCNATSVFGRR
jgi:Na+-transporting NADH:ubiquinone oxidoreductase subunit NqrB